MHTISTNVVQSFSYEKFSTQKFAIRKFYILYSGKLSREKTFADP